MSTPTPEEYRASVSATIDPFDSLQIDFELDAIAEAKRFMNAKPHSSPENTRYIREREPFFADALANAGRGITGTPDPGRALLVLSSNIVLTDSDGERFWMYATDLDRVSVCGQGSPCHKCFNEWHINSDYGSPSKPVEWVFHVATGIYVVEFALCSDCIALYESMSDSIRVQSGDTYIEFYPNE